MVARLADGVWGEPFVAEIAELADVFRRDAMVAKRDEWIERSETIAERSHLAEVGWTHTVLTGSHEVGSLGLRVSLGVELVKKRVADIEPGELVLLGGRRLGEATLHEVVGKGRIGCEVEGAGADAVFHDAIEGERSGITPQLELDRSIGAFEPQPRQSVELRDRHVVL